jgi:hypothetical protein
MVKPEGSLTASVTLGMAKMNETVAMSPKIALIAIVQIMAAGTAIPDRLYYSDMCAAASPDTSQCVSGASTTFARTTAIESENNSELSDHYR